MWLKREENPVQDGFGEGVESKRIILGGLVIAELVYRVAGRIGGDRWMVQRQ